MADIKKFLQTLTDLVRPATQPVGVKMLREGEELPPKTKVPGRDFKKRFAICQANSFARKYGWVLALGKEDQSCPIGSVILGFGEPVDFYTQGNLAYGMFCETLEAGAKSEAAVQRMPYQEYSYLLVGPLARLSVEPDFVLVYGNAAQVMRLVHGALYKEGGSITSSFTGRGECAEIIVNTMKSDACQVILPGNGERVFGQTQDDEMAFTIPFSKIDAVTEGLVGTHKGGVRYPIPNYMFFEAKFPPKYVELEKIWKEREGGK